MHRLGQFYLGRWADDAGGVRVLFRHDRRETITGTKAVAVGTDFYAIRQPDGTISSEVEDVLKTWDGHGATVIRKLLDGIFPLEEDDRMKLGLFLGLQWLRGRHARRHQFLHRISAQGSHGVNLLRHNHGAQFAGHARRVSSCHHQSGEHRTQFAHHAHRNQLAQQRQ